MPPDPTETAPAEGASDDDTFDALIAAHGDAETPAEAPSGPQEPAQAPEAAQAPAAPEEPPAAPETPPPAEDRNLQILAERQRAIRAEQEALRAERAAYQQERAAERAELERFRAFQRKLARQDAYGALADIGIRFDDLTQAVLNGTGVNPTSELEETIQARLTETERRIQGQLESLQAAEQQRLERAFADEVQRRAQTVSPIVAALGTPGVQAVYHRFASAQHQGGSLPSYEDAIRSVEQETLDFLRPLLSLPAVQALLPRQQQAPDASPTLRNQQAATAPSKIPTEPTIDPEDDEALIEHLARKFA